MFELGRFSSPKRLLPAAEINPSGRAQLSDNIDLGLPSSARFSITAYMHQIDIHAIIRILKKEVQRFPKPAVGHYIQSPFTVLVSCLLSLRTQDKTTSAASERLFHLARTPHAMAKLPGLIIEKAIYPVGFYNTKAKNIKKICSLLLSEYNGRVPDDIDELLKLPGVGRKTANLVITLGYNKPGICVDTHVHRITNRWGYVQTKTPEQTEMALREKLPPRYWIIINDLLVAYGQNLCKPISPFCSQCKIESYCNRLGVKAFR
ncbi:MAG: endonuclease III [Desulfobacterales bacterium]